MKRPAYFIIGIRPVKAIDTYDGGMTVLAFNWQTGEFERALEYLDRVYLDQHGDVEKVTEQEFERQVEELRAKLKKPGL
jgi:hypothetical protein